MSSPTPNIPGLRDGPAIGLTPVEAFTYDHIPVLRELLPILRGVPGFYYLMATVDHQKQAEAEGWLDVANTVTFTIEGPAGSCDCKLYCYGDRIPSADYQSSKRECFIDQEIMEKTGLKNESALLVEPEVQMVPNEAEKVLVETKPEKVKKASEKE